MIGFTRQWGDVVRIEFEHHQKKPERGQTQEPLAIMPSQFEHGKPVKIRARTVCRIAVGKGLDMVILGNGVAECSMKDAFSKDEGRVRSLIAALRQGIGWGALDPEEVGTLIDSYNNRPRKRVGILLNKANIMETLNG